MKKQKRILLRRYQ